MATNVPAILGDKKWKCLRSAPGAFHDIHNRWGDSKEKAAVCNCVNLASATSCACCKRERDPNFSVTVNV